MEARDAILRSAGLSQRDRVEGDLHEAGARGVCSLFWYRTAAPNSRNVISVLRASGYHIESGVCSDEHGPAYRRYVLVHGPESTCPACPWTPAQLELGVPM